MLALLSPVVFLVLAASDPEEQPRVLFYCDLTPGSVFHADTSQRVLARKGTGVVYATDADDFAAKLEKGSWLKVYVFARYVDEAKPDFATPLRSFILGNDRRMAFIFLWHDNGESPPAGQEVLATTAMATWFLGGHSTIGYLGGKASDRKKLEPRKYRGLVLPDFEGVEPEPLMPLRKYTVVRKGNEVQGFAFEWPDAPAQKRTKPKAE